MERIHPSVVRNLSISRIAKSVVQMVDFDKNASQAGSYKFKHQVGTERATKNGCKAKKCLGRASFKPDATFLLLIPRGDLPQNDCHPKAEMNLNLSNLKPSVLRASQAQNVGFVSGSALENDSQSFLSRVFLPFTGAVTRKVQFFSFCPVGVSGWYPLQVDIGASIVNFAAFAKTCTNGQIFTGAFPKPALSVLRFLPHAMPGGGSMPLASPVPTSSPRVYADTTQPESRYLRILS